jgi:hypothetical protein
MILDFRVAQTQYTLSQISPVSCSRYLFVSRTSNMTDPNRIYLLANNNTAITIMPSPRIHQVKMQRQATSEHRRSVDSVDSVANMKAE